MSKLEDLTPLINNVREHISSELFYNVTAKNRKAIYDFIKTSEPGFLGVQMMNWLNILTVKKVLPIFSDFYPSDSLPNELIETSLGIVQKTENDFATVEMLEDAAENMAGHSWGYNNMGWKPRLVANAAYYSLREIRGFVPFSHSSNFNKNSNKIWTDDELCLRLDNDAITASAVAWACINSSEKLIYEKAELHEFWEWWLTEAVPQAWELAHSPLGSKHTE